MHGTPKERLAREGTWMGYRRRWTLANGTMELLTFMGLKAWVHGGQVRHNGSDEIREQIRQNMDRVRPIGVKGSALYFGAVLLTAMDRGDFTHADIDELDPLSRGNALYVLEKLKEVE